MGANGSYDKKLGGVPKDKRTHKETGYTIMGHKVLLQVANDDQTKNILNSSSEDSTYLIAKLNEDKTVTVWDVNINTSHKIGTEINLKFDTHGNLIPFNGKGSASHSHKWIEHPNGNMGRKPASNGENTHLPIPNEHMPLINAIEKFNKAKHKYPKK